MFPTSDCLGTQGPLESALFLLNAPPRTPRQPMVGHIKKVCPTSRLIAPIGLHRRAWLQPRQKARLQNRFQANNNRFKLLLPQPSLLQLRLTILTTEGPKECKRDSLLLPSLQIVLATDWRIAAWNDVQQTNRREAGVRIRVLTTGIDDVEIVECELQRTFVRRRSELQYKISPSELATRARGS
jgi:hypothetical protein